MEKPQTIIRTISPGRVFLEMKRFLRVRVHFHQIGRLVLAKDVSFADLKQTLLYLPKKCSENPKIRLRPSYFPFTEPAEVDICTGFKTRNRLQNYQRNGLAKLWVAAWSLNVLKKLWHQPR
jgi:phenylalanyl-tRNA synthetase alpha chain